MLAALALVAAQAAQAPGAYIELIYSNYRSASFNPLDHPRLFFAPSLRAAIDEDTRLANGEVGYLDGDPICQCQDPSGLRARLVRAIGNGPRKATILVLLTFGNDDRRPVTFSLVETRSGWRISDISTASEPSLLKALERSNRSLRTRR